MDVAPEVEVKGGIAPYLSVSDASKAAEFYVKAFGATEAFRYPPDEKGRYLHIHLYVNGGSLHAVPIRFRTTGIRSRPAQGYTLHMRVDDVDAWWKRAVDAGAEVVLPLQRMFWGDRYGQLRDPFGVLWSMGMRDPSA